MGLKIIKNTKEYRIISLEETKFGSVLKTTCKAFVQVFGIIEKAINSKIII